MPFTVIKGTYHLVGRTHAGASSGFEPDGDSIQFRPNDPALLDRLERIGRPYRLTAIGSTQLRFEGIDALELHFRDTHQPRPLADDARDFLTGVLELNPVPYQPPENTRVQPPVDRDAAAGYILSRSLEVNGRPVAFAFAGEPASADGTEVFLDVPLLEESLNHRTVATGNAYPLAYDTLFSDLRSALSQAAVAARTAALGLWAHDLTESGVNVLSQADLEQNGFIFPKLFRRLTEYLAQGNAGLGGFLLWLEESKEQVFDLTSSNFTHFDDLLVVDGDAVRLTLHPEELVFVSAKTTAVEAAPWLSV
jgi:endonuclease YncB( thermonuclease family)